MTQKTAVGTLIPGTAAHRRTEGDYLRALLDTVTLDDWRDVVANTLQAAKGGDAVARAWLGHYLVGRPATNAPSPLTVVVQQLGGKDPVVDRLASPVIQRVRWGRDDDEAASDDIRAAVAAELAQKLPSPGVGHSDE